MNPRVCGRCSGKLSGYLRWRQFGSARAAQPSCAIPVALVENQVGTRPCVGAIRATAPLPERLFHNPWFHFQLQISPLRSSRLRGGVYHCSQPTMWRVLTREHDQPVSRPPSTYADSRAEVLESCALLGAGVARTDRHMAAWPCVSG